MRHITLIAPLGKLFNLMPDVFVIGEQDLVREISDNGFEIESHWNHGGLVKTAFVVARKV